jgi:hypothetical protein
MVMMTMLALAITVQDFSGPHVRATEPRILALINAGLSRSATLQRLVAMLDASDVIVYVEAKRTRPALNGYLAHNITVAGGYRYLHVAINVRGADNRLIPLLAHELQHAVEVAQSPGAGDPESLGRMFERLSVKFGCGGTTCSETQAAKDVEDIVGRELKPYVVIARRN